MRNEWDYEWDRFRKPETLAIIRVRYSANQHRAWHMLDISYLSVNKCSLRCVFCFAPIPPTEPFLGQHYAVLAAAKGQVLAQFCFWFHALNMEKRSLAISRKTLNDVMIHCFILSPLIVHTGFLGGLAGKECLQCRRPGYDPWVGKIPWRREPLPIPVFLPEEFHGQRILASYSLSMKVKAAQLCPTLCNPMDYTVCGIIHARMLECVAIPFSRGSSQPRNRTGVSCIAGGLFTSCATRQSMGSQRVGHNLGNNANIANYLRRKSS